VESASQARISTTPIPKLDGVEFAPGITPAVRIPHVDEEECVGCNLCWLVCPVENCISMEQVDTGKPFQSWAMRSTQ
jgi:dihydropyrimidine dehydrogenase (NAD+) subunit PreA